MSENGDRVGLAERRFLIAAGTSHYKHTHEFPNAEGVASSIKRLAECFAKLGYERALVNVSLDPTSNAFLSALKAWVQEADRHQDDLIVFYYSGHGENEASQYFLATHDSRKDDLDNSALELGRLTNTLLKGLKAAQVLIILDACYAGEGVSEVINRASKVYRELGSRENLPYVYVLATARRKQKATPGAFALALDKVVWRHRAATTMRFLSLDWLSSQINTVLEADCPTQLVEPQPLRPPGEWRLLPNPRFDARARDGDDLEEARRREDFPEHWIYRARGGDLVSRAWYFSGRERALREIVAWLRQADTGGVLVVTGGAGTGKSAILGRLVTLADRDTRQAMDADGRLANVPADLLPPEGAIDAPIVARGKTAEDLIGEIARWLDIKAATTSALIDAAAALAKPLVIVVDALDEARAPDAIADVLRSLAMVPLVKLLVGTRPDAPAGMTGPKVRRLGDTIRLIDLDDRDAYLGPKDIVTYVRRRLLAEDEPTLTTPYRGRPDLAATIAQAVDANANGVFLVARIVSTSLIAAGQPIDTAIAGWADQLPGDIGTAFERDLDRFNEEWYRPLTKARVKALLRPLAYAEGEGLPWDHLWAPIADALVGGDIAFNDEDIEQLQRLGGAYIVRSSEDNSSVYRLYHQALAEHLRPPEREQENERRITETLIRLTPDRPDRAGKDWRSGHAHAYVRTHLATHAARGRLLDELATDPLFLCCANPTRVARGLGSVSNDKARTWATLYQFSVHLFASLSERSRASYLQLAAYRQGHPDLAKSIEALPLILPWRTVWAQLNLQAPHQVLGLDAVDVSSVALGTFEDRQVIVSGGDFMIRRWNAISGEPIGKPLILEERVTSVAIDRVKGRLMIVSGGLDGTIRCWDAVTGEPIGEPLIGHTDSVSSVAVGLVDGRPLIVSGGADKAVRRWDAITGERIGEPLIGHTDSVSSVAVGLVDGRPLIVSGGADKAVRRWDAISGEPIGGPLTGHLAPASSVAIGVAKGRAMIVSSGGSLRRWDAISGELIGQWLRTHQSWSESEAVVCVAIGNVKGYPIIVAGGYQGSLSWWDAISGEPIDDSLTAHQGEIASVAIGVVEGRPIIVSGGRTDGTVKRWTDWGQASRHSKTGVREDLGSISSIAAGVVNDRPVIVSIHGTIGSAQGIVQRWDAISGEPIGEPLMGHPHLPFNSVAIGKDRTIIVAAGYDQKVWRWDAISGRPIGGPLEPSRTHTGPVNSVAIGIVEGRPMIVTGWWDGTIEMWDAVSGTAVRGPLAQCDKTKARWRWDTPAESTHVPGRYPIRAVAIGLVEDQPVIVTGGDDDILRCWHAASFELLGERLGKSQGPLCSLAFGVVEGRPMIVSGGANGGVLCWDARSGELVGGWWGVRSKDWRQRQISSVAIGAFEGRPLFVSGAHDGTVVHQHGWGKEAVQTLVLTNLQVTGVAILPNGRVAVAGDAGQIVLDFYPNQ